MPLPHVWEDLNEGLRMGQGEDGIWRLSRSFFCTDLPGANALEIFSAPYTMTATGGTAHTGGNIPDRWEQINVRGITLWCKSRDADPWPPTDAVVTANYDSESPPVAGFAPATIEVGSTLEQAETVFDADNLKLPFASRVMISVDPPSAYAGADPQYPSVPILVPKPSIVITREQSSSPEWMADRFVGKRNSINWRGYAPGTVLCLSICGRNGGDGIYVSTFCFARDPLGKFLQVMRWKDALGGFPILTAADISGRKGIREVDVQGMDDFNAMSI